MLERILGRDDTSRSASTMLREPQDPAVRLGDSIERYIDALHMAAEDVYHTTSGDPCRARHRPPRSARAAETSPPDPSQRLERSPRFLRLILPTPQPFHETSAPPGVYLRLSCGAG